MSRRAIHQLVAGFREGDAISNAAVVMRRVFRRRGHPSEIVCEARRTPPRLRREISDLATVAAAIRPDDVAVLHLSTGSPVNRAFAALPCHRVILYHNVTPAHYFRFCNPALAAELEEGRRQAAALADAAEINLADSAFNAAELAAMGYRDVRILPLTIDIDAYNPAEADPDLRRRLGDGTRNILFVGRCVPNKKIEDLLTVMHFLQRHIEPASRLVHVGSHAGAEVYRTLLLAQARTLGLRDTLFLGSVTQPQLNACYATADAFLCLSEHEGFCAPLIEAMLHDVPVLARAAAAVPETLAGAGVLFGGTPDSALVAETLGRVLRDAPLRQAILAGQRDRVAAFRRRDLDAELRAALAPFLE